MTPTARIAAVIDILDSLYAGDVVAASAVQALRSGMQRRRYAGSGDRHAISDLFWQIQRGLARLCWHLEAVNADITGRHLVLAALVLMDRQDAGLDALFSADIAHAPAPLSDAELQLVAQLAERQFNAPSMPQHIALEWPEWLMRDAAAGLGADFAENLSALCVAAPTDIQIGRAHVRTPVTSQSRMPSSA